MSSVHHGFQGYALMCGDSSSEAMKMYAHCLTRDIPLRRIPKGKPCPIELAPSGSVEWCLASLELKLEPDYYPEWLTEHLYRKVWRSDEWILGRPLFVKPSDRYKRFTGFVTSGTYRKKRKPPFWYSEVVHFLDEWRYYVADGKVLAGEWYWGTDVCPAPTLNIEIPEGYCGALDFGRLSTGELALVEAQHPFACGWYGDDITVYMNWICAGWRYMLNGKEMEG